MLRLSWLVLALFVAGCGSVSLPERVTQRFATPTPQERVLEQPVARVYPAAEEALRRLGYEVTRSGQAQGQLRGHSRLLPTERFGSSDQYEIEVAIRDLDGGAASVAVLLYETSEGQFAAGGTSTPLREHGRYDAFFATLEQLLQESGAGTP